MFAAPVLSKRARIHGRSRVPFHRTRGELLQAECILFQFKLLGGLAGHEKTKRIESNQA